MSEHAAPSLTIEALTALGAERLAKVVNEIAQSDPSVRRRLEDALRQSPSAPIGPAKAILRSVNRRIAALEEMDVYDWHGAASIGADIDTLRQDIVEGVLPADAEEAADQLKQLVDLQNTLLEMGDDSDGEIGDALRAAADDWGRVWAQVPDRDAEAVADIVFDAFTENDYGVFDEVIPAFAEALGSKGIEALEGLFRRALESANDKHGKEEEDGEWSCRSPGWRRRMLFHGLQDVADLRGDVDAFIAAHEEAGTGQIYAAEIAERLHKAGRHREALAWFERSDRQAEYDPDLDGLDDFESGVFIGLGGDPARTGLHVSILEALGRNDDAQAVRWRAFERTLSHEHYTDYWQKAPEAERETVRIRAIKHAAGSKAIHQALRFLVTIDALDDAESLVLRRQEDWHGRTYWILRPAAEALAARHPVAAALLYRRMTEAVLCPGKSKYYEYAVADLREAALLAEGISDWKGIRPHESYIADLRAQTGRKWSFWNQW